MDSRIRIITYHIGPGGVNTSAPAEVTTPASRPPEGHGRPTAIFITEVNLWVAIFVRL